MRRRISMLVFGSAVACLAVAAASAWAQARKTQPLSFKAETLQNGDYVVRVENLSMVTMTAGLAVATAARLDGRPVERSVRDFDSVIDYPLQASVGHDQVYTFVFWGPVAVQPLKGPPVQVRKQAQLKAIIFGDGSTWGDPAWIARLIRVRNEYLQLTNLLLSETRAAMQSNLPARQLIANLKAEEASRMAAAQGTLDKQIVQKDYGEFIGNLQLCTQTQGRSDADCLRQEAGRLFTNKARLATSRPKLEDALPPAE